MITHGTLNRGGRLGNQMFQYAFLLGVKYKTNFDIVLGVDQMRGSFLDQCFTLTDINLIPDTDIKTLTTFREKHHRFDPDVFSVSDNTDFFGYFQNEKYFEHCSNIVKGQFSFKPETMNRVQSFIQPYRDTVLVSIHIRRTDYVTLSEIHPVCSIEYYVSAMQQFDNFNTTFLVTSDDIIWCKQAFSDRGNFIFSENSEYDFDMCLIASCDHNIIANSSYSWWGAWLGETQNKKIIAPKLWFGDCEHSRRWQMLPTDIVPERWVTL